MGWGATRGHPNFAFVAVLLSRNPMVELEAFSDLAGANISRSNPQGS